MDLYSRLKPPSLKHPLGTDELGRDLLSRIIWGARVSLKVGVISVGIGMIFGVVLGLIGAYFGGVTEKAIFGVVDLLLSMPSLLLALAIVATLGPGITQVMVAVGISLVPAFARVTRGSVLTVKEQNYVLGAKALGASHFDIMTRYILPNVITPVIVLATLNLAFALIMEAALSFLGIGVQPPDPTWGSILSEGRMTIRTASWVSTFSGLAITLTVMGFNLLGDGLRDLLDPRMRRILQAK
jgi:peptide/nickel transport system permease protein